jgi:pimeloyl-ACP methyl ester carboxylesterase
MGPRQERGEGPIEDRKALLALLRALAAGPRVGSNNAVNGRSFFTTKNSHLIQFVLTIALSSMTLSGQAADAPPKPLFPGIALACPCENLTKLSLPNTTIESAALDSNGACRVTAVVTHPSATDRVKVFIGLPVTNWNGRFRGNGGGGFSGGSAGSLRGPVAQGYATAATDTGHEGGSGSFALDAQGRLNWQSIIDNAYLGIHDMTVVGKAVTEAFYGKPARYAYFVGGSTGGRQGLMEAQRYPADYDGIVSGCPAINFHRFVPAGLWPQVVMLDAKNFVPKDKLEAATAAAVKACDASDGATDGVIDDPLRCDYDPKALIGTKVGDNTFTDADAAVVRKIWQGPRAQDGSFLWYGQAPGSDLFALAGTSGSPLKGKPFSITLDYFRFFLVQDPQWDWTTLTPAGFELLWRQSVEQYGAVFGTDDPDLTRFRDRGGRIIIYHGLADQLIPAEGTVQYYKRVQERMGGTEKTAQFARLFLAPGVDHGFRGAGPTPVGLMEAMIRWVEEREAPDKLMAERRESSGKATQTRQLFPYPQSAEYKGKERAERDISRAE